jgi:hypothetical protein
MGIKFWSNVGRRAVLVGLVAALVWCAGPATSASAAMARDHYFDITVRSARCGYEVLPHATWMRPEGQYCIVHLRFRNVTHAPVRLTLTAWFQYAYTTDGTRHPGRLIATSAESRRHNPFFTQVAAGAAANGLVVFDVPKGQRITSLRIKESITSTGVTLRV